MANSNIKDKTNNLAGYSSIAPAPKSAPGKGNVEKPVSKTTTTNPIGRRYLEKIGPMKPKSVPRTYVPTLRKPPAAVNPPANKLVINATPKSKPYSSGSIKAAPSSRMAINPRTGNTTGFTTGTKTGSSASKSGTAGGTSRPSSGGSLGGARGRISEPFGSKR
jgi:hypothetical protein